MFRAERARIAYVYTFLVRENFATSNKISSFPWDYYSTRTKLECLQSLFRTITCFLGQNRWRKVLHQRVHPWYRVWHDQSIQAIQVTVTARASQEYLRKPACPPFFFFSINSLLHYLPPTILCHTDFTDIPLCHKSPRSIDLHILSTSYSALLYEHSSPWTSPPSLQPVPARAELNGCSFLVYCGSPIFTVGIHASSCSA